MEKKLYRDDLHKTLGGVCAGLAEYFGIDVSVMRVLFLLALILKGTGVVLYLVLWAVLPKKPYGIPNINVDYTVPPFGAEPIPPVFNQPKKTSSASVIVGAILVVIGLGFLFDNFDIIPDIDFRYVWPVILIGVGVAVLFSGKKEQPWEQKDWEKKDTFKDSFKADEPEAPKTDDTNPTV
ncbi:PspC domain-containing protein [Mucilaginibacter myungsuensis]|uniref:PspC domain-containing protein n=1 Tax=Mucilaginibacter myungsuensis TaxID=649104 RepID=A0A929KSH4_9SPHI|nr:PspC domain-containing protein [Mucilaginibacter myungsuensis]MBE9660701.1 PspC domain-containing protein [Mucilaginibacter myungsuensis]MDN3600746.1 PspC domain-containing protein [Mucilaginibacter myungsuensis]